MFKIGDLFDIHPTKNYGLKNDKLFANTGNVPVVANKSVDNGIAGYVDLKPTEKGNMIMFSDTTTSDGIFYQPDDYIGYSHIQGLYPKKFSDKYNQLSYMYILTAFRKSTQGLYSYGTKFTRENAANHKIPLPIVPILSNCSPEPDFNYMELFIKAQQKLAIKNVVRWADEQIEATRKVVESNES